MKKSKPHPHTITQAMTLLREATKRLRRRGSRADSVKPILEDIIRRGIIEDTAFIDEPDEFWGILDQNLRRKAADDSKRMTAEVRRLKHIICLIFNEPKNIIAQVLAREVIFP